MRKNVLILGHNDATQFVDIYNQYTRLFDPEYYQVTVATLMGNPSESMRQRLLAKEVIFLNFPKKSIRGLKIIPIMRLYALCRRKKFEIVICHRYKPSYIMMWISQFCQFKALFYVMHELKTMSSLGRRCLIASLNRKNMLFSGVSNAVRDDLREALWFIPKERVMTLYNVMDMSLSEPQLLSRETARQKLAISEASFIFGHIARLVPNKDQHTLIRAFALAKLKCHDAKLLMMGNGILEAQLKTQVAELQLHDDVIFTGYLEGAAHYIKAFDCFVLSSVQEAFGRVLLEAMLAKCPIIATRAHGIPEVMGEEGTLINPGDVTAMAEAMVKYYHQSSADRESLGEKGYAHLSAHYSIPAFHQQFWQIPTLTQ